MNQQCREPEPDRDQGSGLEKRRVSEEDSGLVVAEAAKRLPAADHLPPRDCQVAPASGLLQAPTKRATKHRTTRGDRNGRVPKPVRGFRLIEEGKAMVREPQVLEALKAKLRQLDEASALRHRLRRSLSWLEPTHPLELLDLSAGFENVRQQVQVARMHAQVTRDRGKVNTDSISRVRELDTP